MNASFAIYLLPLAILAVGIYMAVNSGEPMWLVFAAVAAIATGFMARNFLGS